MKRTNNILELADAIFCADLHLKDGIPICRMDEDFERNMFHKLDTISELQRQHNCPVYCAGDLLDYWKPSLYLIGKIIDHLPGQFYSVLGNHELPQHNLDLVSKCGTYVLEKAGALTILPGCHFGQKPNEEHYIRIKNRKLLVWHTMAWDGVNEPYPGVEEPPAKKLLKKLDVDCILTGDNHTPFIVRHNNKILVNPGSMLRLTAGQIKHKPRVYLYYADTNTVKPVYLPIKKNVVSREHIEKEQEINEKMEIFISKLIGGELDSISFEDNLKEFFAKNKIKDSIRKIITKTLAL